MKVIANAGGSKVILEATVTECDRLAGRPLGHRVDNSYTYQQEIRPGTVFDIVAAFDRLHRDSKRLSEVEHARQILSGVIAGLDIATPFLSEPEPPAPAEATEGE